jgi:hypothetical protein
MGGGFWDIQAMKIEFSDNEFTAWDILEYLKRAYGVQINGTPFRSYNITNWIRAGKLPDAYGGNEIRGITRYKELGNLAVLYVEGLSRMDIEATIGSPSNYRKTFNHRRMVERVDGRRQPRKQRTPLYYQILSDAGKQYTVKTKGMATLPDNWKEAGIKKNQLSRKPLGFK